jgi:hypothetical protein
MELELHFEDNTTEYDANYLLYLHTYHAHRTQKQNMDSYFATCEKSFKAAQKMQSQSLAVMQMHQLSGVLADTTEEEL